MYSFPIGIKVKIIIGEGDGNLLLIAKGGLRKVIEVDGYWEHGQDGQPIVDWTVKAILHGLGANVMPADPVTVKRDEVPPGAGDHIDALVTERASRFLEPYVKTVESFVNRE